MLTYKDFIFRAILINFILISSVLEWFNSNFVVITTKSDGDLHAISALTLYCHFVSFVEGQSNENSFIRVFYWYLTKAKGEFTWSCVTVERIVG